MSSSNNNSSSCQLLWPQSVPCSGHGVCVDSKCICEAGYTGIGDFATIEGADCDIDELAIKVLWGITLIPCVITVGLSVRYLVLKRRVIMGDKELSWLETINLLPTCALISSAFMIPFIGLKINNPELAAIGVSPVATVLFGIFFKIFWTTHCVYMYVFLQLTAGQSRMKSEVFRAKLNKQLSSMRQFAFLMFAVDFIWGFCPLILLAVPTAANIIGAIHYIGASLNIAFTGLVVLPRTVIPVRNDIREALKVQGLIVTSSDQKVNPNDTYRVKAMRSAEKKLTDAQNIIWNNAFQQFAIACVFGLWPYLLRKASYQLPLTWAIGQIIVFLEVYTISNFKKSSTSSNVSRPTGDGNNEETHSFQPKMSQAQVADNGGTLGTAVKGYQSSST